MSYRYEQTDVGMDLVIDGFDQGIADSPYLGITDASYGELLSYPGEFSVQFPLANAPASGGTLHSPANTAHDSDGAGGWVFAYTIDVGGQVFYSVATGQTWTYRATVGAGVDVFPGPAIAWWKGYLWVFRLGTVYYSVCPAGGTLASATFTAFGAVTCASTQNAALAAVDDKLYFTNGSSVGVIAELQGSTFDPTNAATYYASGTQLKLPSTDIAVSLVNLGSDLLVGGAANKVYPWDTLSPSFRTPLVTGENFIWKMVTMNTNTFIFTSSPTITASRGFIYITNGSQIDVFKKMPDSLTETNSEYTPQMYWIFGGAAYHRNQLFFGAVASDGVNLKTGTGAVWGIDISTKKLYKALAPTSSTTTIPYVIAPVYTGAAGPTSPWGLGLYVGTNGNVLNYTDYTPSTAAVLVSDKIPVGLKNTKKTFSNAEVKLSAPLKNNDTVLVEAITETSTVTVGTMTSSDGMGAVFPVTFENNQWLQMRTTATPDASTTFPFSTSFCRVKEIRLR